jgi:hypothetical protein
VHPCDGATVGPGGKRQRREVEPQQSGSPTAVRNGSGRSGGGNGHGALGSAGAAAGARPCEVSPDLPGGAEGTLASGDAGSGQHGSGDASSGDKQRQSSVPSHNALLHSHGGSGSGGGNTGPRSGAGSNPQVGFVSAVCFAQACA